MEPVYISHWLTNHQSYFLVDWWSHAIFSCSRGWDYHWTIITDDNSGCCSFTCLWRFLARASEKIFYAPLLLEIRSHIRWWHFVPESFDRGVYCMNIHNFKRVGWTSVRKQKFQVNSASMILANLVLGYALLAKTQPIIIIPPNLTETAGLDEKAASSFYMKAWALYIADSFGNANPATFRFTQEFYRPVSWRFNLHKSYESNGRPDWPKLSATESRFFLIWSGLSPTR